MPGWRMARLTQDAGLAKMWGSYREVTVKITENITGRTFGPTRSWVGRRLGLIQDARHALRSQNTRDLEASEFTTAGPWPLFWSLEVRVWLASTDPLQCRGDRLAGRRRLLGDRLGEQAELAA